jgi:hypothetical protein
MKYDKQEQQGKAAFKDILSKWTNQNDLPLMLMKSFMLQESVHKVL